MASNEEFDEFVTCGVCLWEYDEDIRKPKFLPCSHTVCLVCLQGIVRGTTVKSITCPFCRHFASKDTADNKKWVLPNNTYALQMLKLNKQTAESNSSNSIVAYPKMKNKNVDTLLKLKEELLKIRDTGMDNLALAIQKRKEVQEHMALIIEAINVAGEEARKFQDENNLSLAKMVSVLDENGQTVSSTIPAASQNGQRRDLVLSELMSLVEDSTNDDSDETLKQKMKKSVETYEQQLAAATELALEYELRQKTKIQVHLYDEKDRPIPTLSVLENGFRFQPISPSLNGPLGRQDSKLLSHAVFFLLQRQKISLKKEQQSIACNSKSSLVVDQPSARIVNVGFAHSVSVPSATPASVQVTSLPPSIRPISKKFVLGQSAVFILKLYKSNVYQGEIHIRPSPAFHPTFVQQLGEYCFESPQKFYSYIDKAIPGVFVSFALTSLPDFRPAVPSMFDLSSRKTAVADVNTAIGIAMVESCVGKNIVTSWNFIIPLKDWHNPKCVVSHSILNNELFGRIIRSTTNGSVTIMSQSSKSERARYTLTIESTLKSATSESNP